MALALAHNPVVLVVAPGVPGAGAAFPVTAVGGQVNANVGHGVTALRTKPISNNPPTTDAATRANTNAS